jgi:hypothetical protein
LNQISSKRPILFVDVDGVISLFGFSHADPPPGRLVSVEGVMHCINESCGPRLARLSERYELVWATGWEERANEHLPHLLGLEPAELPVVRFDGRAVFGSAHWKLAALDEYARGRPAAWVDDFLDDECQRWADQRPEPTLLVRTESQTGLTEELVEVLLGWAERLE